MTDTTIIEYRAYDRVAEWMGPIRATLAHARRDLAARASWARKQTTYPILDGIVVIRDPDAPSRCVDADTGASVWPPHGRSHGAVRWVKS